MNNKKLLTGFSLGVMGVAAIATVADDAMLALENQDTKVSKKDDLSSKNLRSQIQTSVGSSAKLNGSLFIDENMVGHFSKLDIAVAAVATQEDEEVTGIQLVTDAVELEDGSYGYKYNPYDNPSTDESNPTDTPEGDVGSDGDSEGNSEPGSGTTSEDNSGSGVGEGDSTEGSTGDTGSVDETKEDTVISEIDGSEGILTIDKSIRTDNIRLKYIIQTADGSEEFQYDDLSYKLPELKGVVSLELDTEKPVIEYKSFNGDTSENGIITRNGNLLFEVTDDIGIDSTKIAAITPDKELSVVMQDNTLSINTNQLDDGEVEINIKVYDVSGNESTFTHNVRLLREAPTIEGESHTHGDYKGSGVTYIKSSMTVKLKGCDNKDIDSVDLLKGETTVQNITDGTFEITSSGEYRVKVTDIAGNVTIYRLEDLFDDLGSEFIVDGTVPTSTILVNGDELSSDWYTETANVVISATDDNGLDKIELKVFTSDNDKEGKGFTVNAHGALDASLSLDLANDIARAKDGTYVFEYVITDMAGNQERYSFVVKADFDNPSIENANLNGTYHVKDNKIFVAGDVSFTADLKDVGSGVKLLNIYRDGELISTSFPLTITDSGSYTFAVSDDSGRVSKEYTLGELLGLDNSSISEVIVDKEAPKISELSGFTPDLVLGANWFKNYPDLRVTITDSNLESTSATINGEKVVLKSEGNNVYSVNTMGVDGNAKLVIVAKDKSENQSSFTFDYSVDRDAPNNVTASINREPIIRFGTAFFNSSPTVLFGAEDNIGIDTYNVDENTRTSNSYEVSNGTHHVVISDKLGNKTDSIGIGSLLGYDTDNFIIDAESPTIECSRPSGDVNNWFSSDVSYRATIEDKVGIYKATATINGEVVDNFNASRAGVDSVDLILDTSKVQPDANGMYSVAIEVEDTAGNKASWADTIFIDKQAPTVDQFVFSGNGSFEGVNLNGYDRYGFFFEGSAYCDIYVSDGEVSSGLKEAVVTLHPENGAPQEQRVAVVGGVARINIPENFKGSVEAYAVDNVGNVGSPNRPDGVVTEDSNSHINSVNIDISLPTTGYTDMSGNPLYNSDVAATATLGCSQSGLRNVEWGVNDETRGSISVDSSGELSGDISSLSTKDKNLVLNLSSSLNVSGNTNGMTLWVRLTDRTGHVSETSRVLSIDKDAPALSVTWDNTEPDGFYSSTRTATISVEERNFDPNQVTITGIYGQLGTWSNTGNTWRNTITFSEDNQYQFGITCTDRAGNISQAYDSESFTIDKTAPILNVSWDNTNAVNGNYYKGTRTATISITDNNFDADRVTFTGSGNLSAWSTAGNVHTARLVFNQDGEHSFTVSCLDKADNPSTTYTEPTFILDNSIPELSITGVQNGISYKKNIGFSVVVSDKLIDKSKTKVTLTGRKNGDIEVKSMLNETTGMFELTSFPEEADFDDIYTLSAVVVDMAGNSRSEEVVFSLNRFGSKYSFADGGLMGNYTNKPHPVEILEENIDQLDISKARVSVIKDGKELKVDDSLISIDEMEGEKGYNYLYRVSEEAFAKDGKYQVQVYSKAMEGTEYSNVSQEYEFVLDSKEPEIIISGVKQGGRYNEYQRKVSIDARDTYGIKDIEVRLNGKKVNLEKKNGIYSFDVRENKSEQYLEVVAFDMAGNKSERKVNNFFISSNVLEFLINQLWFKVGIGAIIAFIGVIIGLIIKNLRDSKKKEALTLDEHEELYRQTVTSSILGASSDEFEKDMAENLDDNDVEYGTVTTSSDLNPTEETTKM